MPSDAKQEFLSAVCAFVRFRPARAGIVRELSAHIDDLAAQKQTQGLEKDEALAVAVSEMGDPAEVGKSLDSAHRPRIEWTVAALALLLIGIGLALQWPLTHGASNQYGKYGYVWLYTFGGLVVLAAAYFFGSSVLRRIPWICLALMVGALCVICAAANRFVRLNAYYVVLLLIPVYAAVLERLSRLRGWAIVLACALCGFVGLLLLILVPHSLAAVIWGLCCAVLLTNAIARGRFGVNKRKALLLVYGAAALCVAVTLFLVLGGREYCADLLRALYDPSSNPMGPGYFSYQMRNLAAAAKPFGQPTDDLITIIPWSILTQSPDFSLAYVLYRFGAVPAALLVLLFAAFFARMLAAVRKLHNEAARLQSLAALLSLGVQTLFYLVFNFGLLPPSGGTLPFISFGALSCLTNMVLLGLLLGNYRVKDVIQVAQVGAMRGLSQ